MARMFRPSSSSSSSFSFKVSNSVVASSLYSENRRHKTRKRVATCFTSEYIRIGSICEEGYAGSLGTTPDLHSRIERAALAPVALGEPVLGGGRSPLLAGLHQLLDSGHQAPLLVADLPDGHDGNTHHRGEGDTPTQHVGPVGKDVIVISAAFIVDPAEDQDQLKGKGAE